MKQTLITLLLGSVAGLLSACVLSPSFLESDPTSRPAPFRQTQTPPRALTHWVDEELIPYLVKQFSQHPRFKNQRFLVVSLQGDEVQPETDHLTYYIRERIRATMLQPSYTNSLWRLPPFPRRLTRQWVDIACGEFNQIHYYVGVDVHRSPLDGAVEVSVRALDVSEKNWVSGFYQSWRGQLSPAQYRELNRRRQDESLRGLRPLPFTADQPDLLATYLAYHLSCRLRHHRYSPEERVLYTPPPDTETRPYFRTALALVGNYLGRFQEVQTTDDPDQATVLLESQVYPLHDNLHQVWITLRDAQNRRMLSGTETEAYVHLAPVAVERQNKATAPPQETQPNTSAQSRLYGSLRRSDPVVDSAALSPASLRSKKLIQELRLSSVADPASCISKDQGLRERWAGWLGNPSPNTPCLALEATLNHSARLVLIGQNSRGQRRWLTPSPCHNEHPVGIYLPAGKTFRLALPPDQLQFLELAQRQGQSQVYAIAEQPVDKLLDERWIHVRDTVAKKLRHNASSYAQVIIHRLGLCDQRGREQRVPATWIDNLKTLAAESGPRLDWQGIRLWHNLDSRL